MKNKKKDIKLLIIIIFTFTLGIVTSGLTISYAATTLSSKNVYYDNTNSGGSSSNVAGAIDELYATAEDQDILKAEIKTELIDIIYPVGSIFMTTDKKDYGTPEQVNEKIGGTWERYATDRTLVGYKDSGNEVDYTNGSKTVKLKSENLPDHTHKTPQSSLTNGLAALNGDHKHGVGLTVDTAFTNGNINLSLGGSQTRAIGWSDSQIMYGRVNAGFTQTTGGHEHTVTGTIPEMTTTECTNCSAKEINVQDPYIVVYMYKRIA